MSSKIAKIDALEILDSRGVPTLRVEITLENSLIGWASVPSGASTGAFEAHELRDGDPSRYGGRGVRQAVENVRSEISRTLQGREVEDQADLDGVLIDLDGTDNKARLGANAIVGVSMAIARAAALHRGLPLYRSLNPKAARLPLPMMNVINGGKHAGNSLEFQEFMIVPHGAESFSEAMRYGVETFAALRDLMKAHGYPTGVGDEGGFAPDLARPDEACELIVQSIEKAGFRPGEQISIALDPAADSFAVEGGYALPSLREGVMTAAELLDLYRDWAARFPIVSLEDGFGDQDWTAFAAQTAAMGDRMQIVGDDLYVTNPRFIARGIEESSTNAVLIKLNQIGSVTETIAAVDQCRKAGWGYVVSHRSGETEDPFIADFAVAMGGGQIKTGSLCRSERMAKYNRLLAIEQELGVDAVFNPPLPMLSKEK